MFVKGKGGCPLDYRVDQLSADRTMAAAGHTVNVTATISGEVAKVCRRRTSKSLGAQAKPQPGMDRATPQQATVAGPVDPSDPRLDCQIVLFTLVGPAQFVSSSAGILESCRRSANPGASTKQVEGDVSTRTGLTTDRQAWATFIKDAGAAADAPVTILASIDGSSKSLTFLGKPPVAPPSVASTVSKLLLLPSKAYRRCHDPLTVVALALNATAGAVAGATKAFSVEGDGKHSGSDQIIKTTDATGRASFVIYSDMPEAVSVVAAATGVDGAPVLSHPSHVFFFEERHHVDRREREYYEHSDTGR